MSNNRNRQIPDYKVLAVAATVANPVLGCVALTTNELAKRRHGNSDLSSANVFYFVTIAFSVFSIGSTIVAVCMVYMHMVLQQQPQARAVKRQPNYWCKKEVVKLNITMAAGVSVDQFCDPNNVTFWFQTIDKARQEVFLKHSSFAGS